MTANRLAEETSPYLRQHANNPVDWYPWGQAAFDAARDQDKPVFVSIGYASCHWCHVMAHESFEDEATAADLRRSFIAIKVDREERPDIDAVYMAATQALTGQGGWPMSVFCTPDGRPFFAGTYYPPTDRHGAPAFRRVLAALDEAWRSRRAEVEEQANAVVAAVAREVHLTDHLLGSAGETPEGPAAGPGGGAPTPDPLANPAAAIADAVVEIQGRFDAEWGGFGPAPKFPRPALVELCLRVPGAGPGSAPRQMATRTLDAMAAGGMYDHLAGGFARYATDRRWLVPHFEKMLPDQALLARTYLHAWRATGDRRYLQVATETLTFVLDELSSPSGALWSSFDADAGGREGSHVTWTPAQVRAALDAGGRPELFVAACEWYGITEHGNWEGTTIPCRPLGAPLERPAAVEEARQLLLAARRSRPQPALDDKVLTEWNAMTAAVLAEAAMLTGDTRFADRAQGIAELLFAELRRPDDGRWLRSWQDGRARHLALAADYGWVTECCVRLGELTGLAQWTARAVETADSLLELFWDGSAAGGGLYTTGHDAETLVVRPRDVIDGALPSASSVAAGTLARLAALSGEDRFRSAAERLVALAGPLLVRAPSAVADLVLAVPLVAHPTEVLVCGDRPDLVAEVHRRWLPDAVTAWGEPTPSPLWTDRAPGQAYVCRGFVCRAPATDAGTLSAQLDELERGGALAPAEKA